LKKRIIGLLSASALSVGITVGASAQAHAYTAFAKCTTGGGGYVQSTSWWNTNGTKTYHWYIHQGYVDVTGPFNTEYNPKQVLIGSKSVYYNSNADYRHNKEGYYTTGVLTTTPTAFYVTGKWYKQAWTNGYMGITTVSCKTSTYL
jgi:hypothetical protein